MKQHSQIEKNYTLKDFEKQHTRWKYTLHAYANKGRSRFYLAILPLPLTISFSK